MDDDKPITALPPAGPLGSDDLFAVVQGGVTDRVTLDQLADAVLSRLTSVVALDHADAIVQTFTQRFAGDGTPPTVIGTSYLLIIDLDFDLTDGGTLLLFCDFMVRVQAVSNSPLRQTVAWHVDFDGSTVFGNSDINFGTSDNFGTFSTSETLSLTGTPGAHNVQLLAILNVPSADLIYYGDVAVTVVCLTQNLLLSRITVAAPAAVSITTESGLHIITEAGDRIVTET